jgi:hypothetical protein
MNKRLNIFVVLVSLLALSLVFIACPTDSGGGGGGSDKWSSLIGNWAWSEGGDSIRLEIEGGKTLDIGYNFQMYSTIGSTYSWGNIWFCSYDGSTFRVYDYPDITKYTFTVVKSSDDQTLTFSNYQSVDSETHKLSYANGGTFIIQDHNLMMDQGPVMEALVIWLALGGHFIIIEQRTMRYGGPFKANRTSELFLKTWPCDWKKLRNCCLRQGPATGS